MKNLNSYVKESINTSPFEAIIKSVLSPHIIKNFEPYKGEDDPDRFEAQDRNAQLICSLINDSQKDVKALTVKEYYKAITGRNPDLLSRSRWSEFDAQHGDIIFVDDNYNALCKIDLKVSERYLGAVSLGSIISFDKNGLYLCCKLSNGQYKIVSHHDVENMALIGLLTPPSTNRKYKGKSVVFNGQELTDEYFIKGIDIEKL